MKHQIARDLKSKKRRKGSLEETISFAMYKDNSTQYEVSYRDKDRIAKVNLKDFLTKEEFAPIPLTTIIQISKNDDVVWKKGQKEVAVKR